MYYTDRNDDYKVPKYAYVADMHEISGHNGILRCLCIEEPRKYSDYIKRIAKRVSANFVCIPGTKGVKWLYVVNAPDDIDLRLMCDSIGVFWDAEWDPNVNAIKIDWCKRTWDDVIGTFYLYA